LVSGRIYDKTIGLSVKNTVSDENSGTGYCT